jgi:hypothetical protein
VKSAQRRRMTSQYFGSTSIVRQTASVLFACQKRRTRAPKQVDHDVSLAAAVAYGIFKQRNNLLGVLGISEARKRRKEARGGSGCVLLEGQNEYRFIGLAFSRLSANRPRITHFATEKPKTEWFTNWDAAVKHNSR